MVRIIHEMVDEDGLKRALESYRRRAIELGATDARVIHADAVIIDDRVRAKCMYPRCRSYGTNANCPPYCMGLDEMRRLIASYKWAVFFKFEVSTRELAGPEARKKRLTIPTQKKCHEIVSKIESEAFTDGYYLAVGFAAGPCKNVFCPDDECSALVPGGACRHPLRARPSMEAVGMDAFRMAAKLGWEVYPIGASTAPTDVAHGVRLGIVMIQ